MTKERRAAIGECMGIITLLVETKTPHAKELALIVLQRAAALLDGKDLYLSGDQEIQAVSLLCCMLGVRPPGVQ